MHNRIKICHRDIKPDNLLIDKNDNLKIGDFGVSALIENDDDEVFNKNLISAK